MTPKICLIAAVAENGVIGKDGDLPWKIASDWQYFKEKTLGKPVIMGRRCFESLGEKPLKGRPNIILTRTKTYDTENTFVVGNLEEALTLGKKIGLEMGAEEIMICGGEDIYRRTLPLADRLYINEVHLTPEGDTFFPEVDRSQWQEIRRDFCKALTGETADYTITVLERQADKA